MEVDLQKNPFSVLHNENEKIRKQKREEKKSEKEAKRLEEQQSHHAKLLESISEGRWDRKAVSNWADLSDDDDDDFFYDTTEKLQVSATMGEQREPMDALSETASLESDSDEYSDKEDEKNSEIVPASEVLGGQSSETPSAAKKKEKATGKSADFKRKQKQNMKQKELDFLQSMLTEFSTEAATQDKTKEMIDSTGVSHSAGDDPTESTLLTSSSAAMKLKKKKKRNVEKSTEPNTEEISKEPLGDVPLSTVSSLSRDEALKRLAAKALPKKKEQPMEEIKKALVEEAKKKKSQKKEKKDKLMFPKRQNN